MQVSTSKTKEIVIITAASLFTLNSQPIDS